MECTIHMQTHTTHYIVNTVKHKKQTLVITSLTFHTPIPVYVTILFVDSQQHWPPIVMGSTYSGVAQAELDLPVMIGSSLTAGVVPPFPCPPLEREGGVYDGCSQPQCGCYDVTHYHQSLCLGVEVSSYVGGKHVVTVPHPQCL